MRIGATLCSLALALAGTGALAAPRVDPSIVPLEDAGPLSLVVTGLAGRGPAAAASNVGRVTGVSVDGDRVTVKLDPPASPSPQTLCLAVWRRHSHAAPHLLRVSLLGRSELPVTSRPRAEVRVRVGDQRFGPVTTNLDGKAKVPILVAPGTDEAVVEVVDRVGMVTEKKVKIEQPPHNLLTVAILARPDRVRFVLATCAPDVQVTPQLAVAEQSVPVKRLGRQMWEARWTAPLDLEPEAPVKVSASLPGDPISTVERELTLPAAKPAPEPSSAPTARPAAEGTGARPSGAADGRRLHVQLGATTGLMHNLGDLLAPRFVGEVGLLYRLPRGQIGPVVSVGYSWAGQTVAGDPGEAEASVGLVPLGVGLTYRLPLGRLAAFVSAGYLLQIVSTHTRADFFGEDRRRVDAASGFQGTVGAAWRLGPGSVLLQSGYLWSRVENVDVQLLAGGIVIDAGYRIQL